MFHRAYVYLILNILVNRLHIQSHAMRTSSEHWRLALGTFAISYRSSDETHHSTIDSGAHMQMHLAFNYMRRHTNTYLTYSVCTWKWQHHITTALKWYDLKMVQKKNKKNQSEVATNKSRMLLYSPILHCVSETNCFSSWTIAASRINEMKFNSASKMKIMSVV